MENIASNITEYRKKLNLTQKDLGDMLNISPQAVSKWENGQAEPDTSTIKRLCQIFKITTDELLGLTEPADETAAATAVAEQPARTVEPAPTVQQIVEQKIINGYCERCKKPVGPGEYVVEHYGRGSSQRIYCNECNEEMQRSSRRYEYANHKRQTVKSLIVGGCVGVAVLLAVLLTLMIGLDVPAFFAIPFAIVFGVAFFSFAMQMFWDGTVNDMFFFFLKSFRMPGVIFTLDLNGLLFLIFVKVFGAILSVFLSILFFIIGMIITPLGSIIILPFAAIKRSYEAKKLKAAANT